MSVPTKCPECGGKLEEGFIPDATYGQYLQTHWHSGPPEKAMFFGLNLGAKVSKSRMHPIKTFRCSGCGLLRSYAEATPVMLWK